MPCIACMQGLRALLSRADELDSLFDDAEETRADHGLGSIFIRGKVEIKVASIISSAGLGYEVKSRAGAGLQSSQATGRGA